MRKFISTIILSGVISLSCAAAAFAAGWAQENDTWCFYNNSGDKVTSEWRKSGDKWYYLDEDGYLAIDKLVNDKSDYYYVDEHGAMLRDTWVPVKVDEDEDLDVNYRWYYFGSTGAAYRKTGSSLVKKTINGKTYSFDEDGKMLFGFVDEDGTIITEDEPVKSAKYYFGSNDDGAMYTGWLKYDAGIDEYEKETLWFWFDNSGKKVSDAIKTISGRKYNFDIHGVMVSEWKVTASATNFYSNENDGHMQKKSWVWAVPSEDVNAVDHDENTYRWFYMESSGNTVKNATKKINSKWYVFDTDGIMKTEFVTLNKSVASGATPINFYKAEDITAEDIYAMTDSLFYFSGNEESDGAMKTGTVTIELEDDIYTFGFNKQGCAYNGVNNSKVYRNGILQKAGDKKYKAVCVNGQYFVVGSSGAIVKGGSTGKDDNDDYYAVAKGFDTKTGCSDPSSYIKKFSGNDASKAASWYSKNGNMDGFDPDNKYSWSMNDI